MSGGYHRRYPSMGHLLFASIWILARGLMCLYILDALVRLIWWMATR